MVSWAGLARSPLQQLAAGVGIVQRHQGSPAVNRLPPPPSRPAGDLGRSRPSLGDLLGCRAQIVSLDVLEVHMEFGG
jgi:hypothetical protein